MFMYGSSEKLKYKKEQNMITNNEITVFFLINPE